MAERFNIDAVNSLQPLTEGGADFKQMQLNSFEQKPVVSLAKPALDVGGMKP